MSQEADTAVRNALPLEVKKDSFSQLQAGSFKVTFTINPAELRMNDVLVQAFLTAPPGTRYLCTLVELAEDETPVDQAKKTAVERPKKRWADMSRAQQAGILCAEPAFQNWFGFDVPNITPDQTAEALRIHCVVNSRANLDTDQRAGRIFDELVARYHEDIGRTAERRT